jgi:hypothetical protein
LPFDSCDQFVSFLVNQATDAARQTFGRLTVRNHQQVARALGVGMMQLAFSGYERHIHNGFLDFKPELIANGQGAGVYGHILGLGGAYLAGPAGLAVGGVSDFFDRAQKLWGTEQGAAEVAGNQAGIRVGARISNFINGPSRDRHSLFDDLRSMLCE